MTLKPSTSPELAGPARILHPPRRRQHRAVREPELQPVQRRQPGSRPRQSRCRRPRTRGEPPARPHPGPRPRRRDRHLALGARRRALAPTRWSPRVPGLALGVVTADCTPVLLADTDAAWSAPCTPAGAAPSPGCSKPRSPRWRRSAPTRIAAAIGPSIRQQSYEVRADLRDAVLSPRPGGRPLLRRGRPGHWQFDLAGYCAARLAGLAAGRHHRRRHRRRARPLLQPPPPHAGRRRPDRAPDSAVVL